MGIQERLASPGPKRLLALDGGGIRGVLTLEVLAEMESLLRRETGSGEDFVLADYFDYVAGTSTGAIIAAGLSLGKPVAEILDLYVGHGEEMFDKVFITKRFRHIYDSGRLRTMLQDTFGPDTTLGSDRLRTLLMMVLRNASTDSPWPISNNPAATYNARADGNLQMPLWQLVRASAAAPVYFPPELVTVGSREFVFVDGGLTMYNNPAFQLFLMATMGAYRLRWPAGEENLLVVSVGTGTAPKANDRLRPGDLNLLYNAGSVPAALMAAALHEQDLLCRVFGRCRHGAQLDREVGDLMGEDVGLPGQRLFSYVRYNAELTDEGLAGRGLGDIDAEQVRRLDSVENVAALRQVGRSVAEDVRAGHFKGFL
jgi:patatin-like phospholipase/acyl hydrolase